MPRTGDPPRSYFHETNGRVPVPDPTALTTEQLNRAIAALRDLIETRLGAMDKAIDIAHRSAEQSSMFVRGEVAQLERLHDAKFAAIAQAFTDRDRHMVEAASDNKIAMQAALKAAKELSDEQNRSSEAAAAKSEAATTKQIDALGSVIQAGTHTVDGKIGDIKDRLTIIEGKALGTGGSVTMTISIASVIIASVATLASVAALLVRILR